MAQVGSRVLRDQENENIKIVATRALRPFMALNAERPLFHNQILFHLLPPSLLSSRTIAWATLHAILFRLIVRKWYRCHDKRRTMLNLRPRPVWSSSTNRCSDSKARESNPADELYSWHFLSKRLMFLDISYDIIVVSIVKLTRYIGNGQVQQSS